MEPVDIILVLIAWVASGALTALVMRGHDLAARLAPGSLLGPSIIALAGA